MTDDSDIRPGETRLEHDPHRDAWVQFIGVIRTPFLTRADCPRQGKIDGPLCEVEVYRPWEPALNGLESFETIELLYWLDRSRRDLLTQSPKSDGQTVGTFALRSPVRPNPIGTSRVSLERIVGPVLYVRGLDCLNGTPLVDIKPDRCAFTPQAPAKPLL